MQFQSGAEDLESLGELPMQFSIQRLHSDVKGDSNRKPKMHSNRVRHAQASPHSIFMVYAGPSPLGTAMHIDDRTSPSCLPSYMPNIFEDTPGSVLYPF